MVYITSIKEKSELRTKESLEELLRVLQIETVAAPF